MCKGIDGLMPSPRVLAWSETQTVSSRSGIFWIWMRGKSRGKDFLNIFISRIIIVDSSESKFGFPSPARVTLPRLKRRVCPTIYPSLGWVENIQAFPKRIRAKHNSLNKVHKFHFERYGYN